MDIASHLGGAPEIIEAELFEPAYFVRIAPEAVTHFVEAVKKRCRQ